MLRKLFAWVSKYERHLSAGAMVVGIVVDQLFFGRIDLWQTQAVFAGYALVCFVTIPLMHWIEARALRGEARPRWRALLPIATQFALGGFWSGFLVFYGRSAAISGAWPFLLFLVAVLIGNEVLAKYHTRLVFTSVLFFFALYSYAIFAVPIYANEISVRIFLLSGLVAVIVFAAFTALLRVIARERFREYVWRIRLGAIAILAIVNVFYFTDILPPLPLSARHADVYHSVSRIEGDGYTAMTEPQSWKVRYLGMPASLHLASGESLYAYSAVFAPVQLATVIIHEWQWFDPMTGSWVTKGSISFPITGGRDGGYRGYSAKTALAEGKWRVNVRSADGRLIARIPFRLITVELPADKKEITLD